MKGFRHILAASVMVGAFAHVVPALGQTPAGGPPPPPKPPAQSPSSSAPAQSNQSAARTTMPVPESVVIQAEIQAEGYFGPLERPRTSGQVQDVWEGSKPEDAVYVTDLCTGCTYKVRTREHMVTIIELPRGEVIDGAPDLGDKTGFRVSPRGDRRLAVQPVGHGYDSSLIVYGKSGTVYPFYLRAEGFNSINIPDLVVRINGSVLIDGDPAVGGFDDKGKRAGALAPMVVPTAPADQAVAGLKNTNPSTPAGDFVANAPFDPNALRGWGEYKLWGSDDTLKPETVFRDDHFTYVRFGKRWKDVELPTAYVVVDGIDELVNTRVQGETFIIESTRPLITLKSGSSYMCIQYEGEQ